MNVDECKVQITRRANTKSPEGNEIEELKHQDKLNTITLRNLLKLEFDDIIEILHVLYVIRSKI